MHWFLDKIRDILPNRPYGKTAKDTRIARLIDLNKTISSLNLILADIEDSVNAIISENTYNTSVYETYPYIITPTLVQTTTFINNTGNGMFTSNLQGFKVGGTIDLAGQASYSEYVGTVTYEGSMFGMAPYKTTGSVTYIDNLFSIPITNALGTFNNILDTGGGSTYCQIYFIQFPNVVGSTVEVDIVMYVDQTSLATVVGDMEGIVSFEYEFLLEEGITPTFNI
jgi:hypothetical protein